jgi:hypothetical protein
MAYGVVLSQGDHDSDGFPPKMGGPGYELCATGVFVHSDEW